MSSVSYEVAALEAIRPVSGVSVALKVEDGAKRAAAPALIHVLPPLTPLSDDQVNELANFAGPDVVSTLGGGSARSAQPSS